MDKEELKSRLTWILVVTNLIAGMAFVITAFGVVTGERRINVLYLTIGVTCLVASGAWLLNMGSS
jgi:ABC-type multidrug transport system permease subunit